MTAAPAATDLQRDNSSKMKKASFRPCIDLHNGCVKQIVGGTLDDSGAGLRTNFVSGYPPEYYAGLYRQDGLTGGHVIRLGAGNTEAARRALQAWPGGLHIGGGVNAANAAEWLEAGAGKVIVTSFIFADGELKQENLDAVFAAVGREHLVIDLSCRRFDDGYYYVMTDRWQKRSNMRLGREAFEFLAGYASEFLVHAVAAEGLQQGIDAELVASLAQWSPLLCVYAGGIASMDDVALIESAGLGKVDYTIGSALDLFGGKISYRDVVRRSRNAG